MTLKYLITSGCSFSDNINQRWPHYLANELQYKLYNRGQGSCGNDYIAKSAIHQLNKLLSDNIPAEEILCVVMWSGIERKSIYINKTDTVDFDSLQNNIQHAVWDINNPLSIIDSLPNEAAAPATTNGYLVGSAHCAFSNRNIKKFKSEYILKYYPAESLAIESYEHFLRLQWYCESKHIQLRNLTYMNIMTYPYGMPTRNEYAEVDYLSSMIDYNNWIFWGEYGGLYEYTRDNNLEFGPDGVHPKANSHNHFVKNFLLNKLR